MSKTGDLPDGFVEPDEVDDEISEILFGHKHTDDAGGGGSALAIIGEWIESDDPQAKTNITPQQARPMMVVHHMDKLFPTICGDADDPYEALSEGLEDYQKLLTSINGLARDQQQAVLQSLAGGGGQVSESEGIMAALAEGFNATDEDDD